MAADTAKTQSLGRVPLRGEGACSRSTAQQSPALPDLSQRQSRPLQGQRSYTKLGNCIPATLLIDTEAPLDVLFETADYRIRTVTQLLEDIAFHSDISADTMVLSDFCKMLTIALRDGCDWEAVTGPGC